VELRVELFPDDLDRFVDFYVRVLRFELVDDRRADASPYVEVRRGGARIGAVPAWQGVDATARAVPQGVELVLVVEDLVAERDQVVAAGWPLASDVTRQPWGLEDFRLFDPDGHYLRFTST
jgi:lactoylglutathione lyase